MRRSAVALLVPALLVSALPACDISEGDGEVTSERLFIEDCWEGPFDLQPTFFAANPFNEMMMIRVQRADGMIEISDGVMLVVNDVPRIREEQLGQDLPIGLPVGVSPPGQPEQFNLRPPPVSLTLYLFETCHLQNGALEAVDGTIRFDSLFSGDRNENRAEDRLTEATFEAIVVDPRRAVLVEAGNGSEEIGYPEDQTSTITGRLRFFFQRGIPAQPFP